MSLKNRLCSILKIRLIIFFYNKLFNTLIRQAGLTRENQVQGKNLKKKPVYQIFTCVSCVVESILRKYIHGMSSYQQWIRIPNLTVVFFSS